MKSKLRISLISTVIIFVAGFVVLICFTLLWQSKKQDLNSLATSEETLQRDIGSLEHYGKWTLDYVRIERGLGYLSKNKISKKNRMLLTEQIWKTSRSYSIDPLLILAIVYQESRGNPRARGKMRSGAESGAYGLMQIKLETARQIGARFGIRIRNEKDLLNPEVNVVIGSAFLLHLMGIYKNLKYAIIAYNVGPGTLNRALRTHQPLPTRYYEHVFEKYRKLEKFLVL